MDTSDLKKRIGIMALTLTMVSTYLFIVTIGNENLHVYAADSGPNAQYSLAGAEYWVYTNSSCSKRAEDANGHYAVFTTGADGTANEIELNEGTYYVKEAKASKGYVLDTTVYTATVASDKTSWVNPNGGKQVKEVPQSAPLSIQKIDKETGNPVALGSGSLANAQFEVAYSDGTVISRKWIIKTDDNGIAKLDEAHKVSGSDFYKNSKGECVVPLGKVTITEIEPSMGYLKNNGTITIKIDWDGASASNETTSNITVSGASEGYTLGNTKPIVVNCPEQIKRGDIKWNKISERTHARLSVPFVITSATTGEAHVVYTDANGFVTTNSSEDKGGTAHSTRTNENDNGVITPEGAPILDENGHVNTANLKNETGIWFGKDKKGNVSAAVNNDLGALPYDTYYVSELPVPDNDGYTLVKDVRFVISRDLYEIEGGTLDNQDKERKEEKPEPEPEPGYDMYKVRNEEATDNGDGKFGFQSGDFVTYDVIISNTNIEGELTLDVSDEFAKKPEYFSKPVVVKVENATQNRISEDKNTVNITVQAENTATVTYSARILSKAEEYLADKAGDSDSKKGGLDCNKADRDNKPDEKDGYRNMAYAKNVWYKTEEGTKKQLESKEDDAQTPVKVPVIGTYLADDKNRKTLGIDKEITIIDTIAYEGLTPGRKYAAVGELMVKEEKELLVDNDGPVVSVGTFTAKDENGSTVVEFTVNTKGLAGKHLVAFETLYNISGTDLEVSETPTLSEVEEKGILVAEHKNLKNKDQTVLVESPGETIKRSPDTGDKALIICYAALLASAAAGLVIMIKLRIRSIR